MSESVDNRDIPDSLLTKDHIYDYTFSDKEKAKQIIKLMRQRKLETASNLDIAEGDLHFNNGEYNEALIFYTCALKNAYVQNNATEYMEQLHRMISCYGCLHDEKNEADYVKLLLEKAEETGNKEMKSIALFNMGKMIYYQENKSHGYQLIKEAIEEMKLSDYKYKYDNLRYNYNTLLMMQQRDGEYQDALQTLDALEGVVAEATQKEPNIEGLDKKERKTMLAWRAVILAFLNRIKEADRAYKEWEAIDTDYTKDDYLITSYLIHRKRFDKVIAIYTPRECFLKEKNDTINYHMRTIKRLLGKAYEGKNDYLRAAQYYKELAILTDSLKGREQRSSAVELATVYETHQNEMKLQEQITHVKSRNILLFSACIVILSLLILLWYNLKHTSIIRHKNRLMATTIEELLVQKEELFETKEKLNTLKVKQIANSNELEHILNSNDECDSTEDSILFETLDSIVIRKKLYLNPDLSRDDLMALIHVNKNRFGQIIQQYTGNNSTTYINNKRLEYAAKLLKSHPDFTILAIADSCGIPNIPTFNRLFRTKYGMTPTEFKNC